MSPTFDAFLRSWPFDPWLIVVLAVTASVYARGWWHLQVRDPVRWHVGRLAAFLGGLTAIFLALASPIEPFTSLLLQVHMLQHLLLMMIAPPLVWLGWPLFPLVRGLPEPVRTVWVAPLLRSRRLRRLFGTLTHPLVAWPIYVATTWLWHTPRGYELALASDVWHVVEHACFTAAAMLFWFPVVRPYPSRPRWSEWLLLPYLLLADVQNTVLAAWLTFSGSVLYPHYLRVPRLAGISALDDQAAAGVLMWVPGSAAFLVPLVWIGVAMMRGEKRRVEGWRGENRGMKGGSRPRASAKPQAAKWRHGFDWLGVPGVGAFLRSRYGRRGLQVGMFVLAAVVIFDGLVGPQVSPMNLAGVAPWIHWRGFLILGLLVAGNLFCMACPFTLPRSFARRWMPSDRPWPRWLRSKWLAVGLVAVFLWSYEAFALWDSPWITAWIAIAYFLAAFVVDSFFRDAAFCKYVCPIGQFNFMQSLVSPLEVAVREPAVCVSCTTKDCIRGNATASGCEMQLYQPRKVGNFDCTFCLDCVRACPHENVGVLAVVPGRTLWSDAFRSGIGRLSRRPDIAALVVVLVFGAFANAAGMVAPVLAWQERLRAALGEVSPLVVTTLFYAAVIGVMPLMAVGIAAVWSKRSNGWLTTATRFSFALVPIGFAMWLAHYSFHLLTSIATIVPATQRFAADRGWQALGAPLWQCSCCGVVADWVPHLEILMLDFGLLLSLYAGWRIAESQVGRAGRPLRAFAPWGMLIVALFAVGVWIVFQPMEMRGTMLVAD
jgi:cytochrome c oxidase assembly factor CtaG